MDLEREIVDRQEREGWGAGVISRLLADLRREFPGARDFSNCTTRSARAFYLAYASAPTGEVSGAGPPINRQQAIADMDGLPRAGSPAEIGIAERRRNHRALGRLASAKRPSTDD